MKQVGAALVLLFITASGFAATKNDIRGLSPGMTQAQAAEHFPCKKLPGYQIQLYDNCDFSDGSITLIFTKTLEPNLLKEINYKFVSGTGPKDMIAAVSQQFNAQLIKLDWSHEIADALRPNRSRRSLVKIAAWNLDDNAVLELTSGRPTDGSQPYEYILKLTS